MVPKIAEAIKTKKKLDRLIALVGTTSNMLAPVAMDRLPTEIAVHRPQPINIACTRIRSATPVGMLVRRTSKMVPVTME